MVRPRGAKRNAKPHEVRGALMRKGASLAEIARRYGISDTAVRRALRMGDCPSAERAIADFLGTTPQAIWPKRFYLDGRRRTEGRSASPAHKSEGCAA